MKIPSGLLECMRVGVGVGAVMLGGCDVVSEAKARVFGDDPSEEVAAPAPAEAPAAAPAETRATPEPMLLSRGGVAGVVDEITRSESKPASPPPVQDLGRSFASPEPEGSRAFVPYDGGGALAVAPRPERTATPSKSRPKRKAARPDEPCQPSFAVETPPDSEWQCPACGRG